MSNFRRILFLHVFVLIAFANGLIWVRIATVRESYRFVQSEKQLQTIKQEVQALRVRWTRLTAPQRLITAAKEFNLEPPKIEQTLKQTVSQSKNQL